MTDSLSRLADDHEALHEYLEGEIGRELTPQELEDLAEEVVEMSGIISQ